MPSRLPRSITFRLFVVTAAVQTAILAGLAFGIIKVHESHLTATVTQSAVQVSDLIAGSTRSSMLRNEKDEVQNIVASLGHQPGIEGIRIFNKQGEIIFSTDPLERGKRVNLQAEACVTCHTVDGSIRKPQDNGGGTRLFRNEGGERVLGLIRPINNERQCSDAHCHAHDTKQSILGVLDVRMSLAVVDAGTAESRNQLIALSVAAVLLMSLVSGGFIWWFVRRPVNSLMLGMKRASSGRLEHRLEVRTTDELGQLAEAFNTMMEDLARARKEVTDWSRTLEERVREKTADLERAHRHMLRAEKMASVGNLAASVAHEINNPLEGILTFAKLLLKRLQRSELAPDFIESARAELQLVADEAQRCGDIVKNLLVFSRKGALSFQRVHVGTIVSRSVMLVRHRAETSGIVIHTDCTHDDEIECDQDQLQQVLIALMINAVEAMSPPAAARSAGRMEILVRRLSAPDRLIIAVRDSGVGMDPEVQQHVFEPFFTTKTDGKGVGLGLAVAYGIVERHHGTITIDSEPGKGTVFTLTLPDGLTMDTTAGPSPLRQEEIRP